MATKLRSYDWTKPSKLTQGDKATHPWHEWFDSTPTRLSFGEDFQNDPLMMERIIRTRATGKGVKVKIRHEPITVNGRDDDDLTEVKRWLAHFGMGLIVLQSWTTTDPAKARAKKATKRPAAKTTKKAPAKKAPAKRAATRPTRKSTAVKHAVTKRPPRTRRVVKSGR
jgi:hypothetical protein